MILMPILMFLPLLALPVFWLLPLKPAIIIYLCIVTLSAAMFRAMRKAKKLPPMTGAEYLVGKDAKVVSKSPPEHAAPYLVRLDGELWSAESEDILRPGERVIIEAVKSNFLVVKKAAD